MAKNTILTHQPEMAFVDRLRTLERNLKEFKLGVQAPTIRTTLISGVVTQVFSSWVTAGGARMPMIVAQVTLVPPTNEQVLFAIPELFFGHWGVTQAAGIFPEGTYFSAQTPGSEKHLSFLDVTWWPDLNDSDDKNLVAYVMFRLDAAMWGLHGGGAVPWEGLLMNVGVRWRYMVEGAS